MRIKDRRGHGWRSLGRKRWGTRQHDQKRVCADKFQSIFLFAVILGEQDRVLDFAFANEVNNFADCAAESGDGTFLAIEASPPQANSLRDVEKLNMLRDLAGFWGQSRAMITAICVEDHRQL